MNTNTTTAATATPTTPAKDAKQAKTAKTAKVDASQTIEPKAKVEETPILIDDRKHFPSMINKHVSAYLSDHGRAKQAIARFATSGRIGADLKAVKNENVKAVQEAYKAGALNALVSDPAKFAKRAAILVRLAQALQDLEAL